MRSVLNALSGRGRFVAGVVVGIGAVLAGASMLGMAPPTGLYVTDGDQVQTAVDQAAGGYAEAPPGVRCAALRAGAP